ncbi:reprolysin-like metallopeptidase [Lysobacter sp. 22409]|uniref:reprolysin-like metallopeptidase n=1 Tax=Lysobacter sp. 22409 TaxID=3453917 RepID=UPI003F869AFC
MSAPAMRSAPTPFADPLSARLASRRIAAAGFARLPDRGDLAAYPSRQPAISEGAYTWHRVELSEQHALAATVGGHLRITAPSGEKLDFRYERHVEHPSGDWTWVGRIDRGGLAQEAIITFGERAVFGSIAQPGKPALKLTLRDGKSWLIETDPAKLALLENSIGPDHADDYLIPSAAANASSVAPASASIGAAETAADGQVLVDVLVGYSNGFANGLGGASQAVTRLNYLVEVTNQAYVNSQITARIRMVHAMQVNYADSSDNGSALEKLTGTRTTPVDPAFNALRAARDQYGADLVSFVRKYDRTAQDGCGIAWLLGGGQQPITTSSAPNGYSVVSDGRQNDGGTTYFCRDETFAHELGHNMGAQHDRATASSGGSLQYGAYAYSFGYKAGAGSGNFYDIMAYGDAGQTSYRVFSNPRITSCGGFACGVGGQADTAQTLNQTMPIIATFRATAVPQRVVRGDVNGDGWADLLWRNASAHQFAHWLAGSSDALQGFASAAGFDMVSTYDVGAVGDFNGDGRGDVLWKNEAERFLVLWLSSGGGYTQQVVGGFEPDMTLVGSGDVNGDGRHDLIWRSLAGSRLRVWLMQANQVASKWDAPMPSWFQILGVGDFDGDGRSDVVYADDAQTSLYFSRGNYFAGQSVGARPAGWSYVDSADINGDGRDDMVWLNPGQNVLSYWVMNGASIVANPAVAGRAGEAFFAARDVNGDGRADLIWNAAAQLKVNIDLTGSSQRYSNAYPAGWQMRR